MGEEERLARERAEKRKRERRCPECDKKTFDNDSEMLAPDLYYHTVCIKCKVWSRKTCLLPRFWNPTVDSAMPSYSRPQPYRSLSLWKLPPRLLIASGIPSALPTALTSLSL